MVQVRGAGLENCPQALAFLREDTFCCHRNAHFWRKSRRQLTYLSFGLLQLRAWAGEFGQWDSRSLTHGPYAL